MLVVGKPELTRAWTFQGSQKCTDPNSNPALQSAVHSCTTAGFRSQHDIGMSSAIKFVPAAHARQDVPWKQPLNLLETLSVAGAIRVREDSRAKCCCEVVAA